MNEVKELVEELRNKKSRDNRDLLDRSADMIEKLAKDLCDKSGCHHKCNDTKDCVVEDEAKELFKQALVEGVNNRIDKTIEKEKQIEEMVKTISTCECNCLNCKVCYSWKLCEALYNAGYRKQSEWISVDDRLPDNHTKCLAVTESGDYYTTYYHNGFYTPYVTHWMPLPEAPKMKGGEE